MPARAVEEEVKVQVEPNKKLLKRKQQVRVQLTAEKCSLMMLHSGEVPMTRAAILVIRAEKDLSNPGTMWRRWSISA
jgi:hypothetical protein